MHPPRQQAVHTPWLQSVKLENLRVAMETHKRRPPIGNAVWYRDRARIRLCIGRRIVGWSRFAVAVFRRLCLFRPAATAGLGLDDRGRSLSMRPAEHLIPFGASKHAHAI